MKKKLEVCALAACLALVAPAVEVDGIAAQVGDETILKSDVVMEMRRLRAPASAYADVRNDMIDRKLILRAARAAKMTMQDWVIENRVRDIIDRSFGGDRNKLMETLSREKISYPEWHARMKEDMVVAAMKWNVIDRNATARPGEMRRLYDANPARYAIPGKVTVSIILLSPDAISNRVDVSAALKTNDFAEVARRFSVDSHAADGGVWKAIEPKEVFKPAICDEIAKMPLHTLSRWIELDGWSFLLRKDAVEGGQARSFEEAYDDVEADVRAAEAKKAYEAWMERLKQETYIKVY